MKPLYCLHVIPSLPDQLTPLWELGHNLWWSWSKETIRTLYQIDPETYGSRASAIPCAFGVSCGRTNSTP